MNKYKRKDPQWRKFGLKAIDLVRKWEAVFDEEYEKERLAAAARMPKKKAKGVHDENWARNLLAKKEGGRVKKVKGKSAKKGSRKW